MHKTSFVKTGYFEWYLQYQTICYKTPIINNGRNLYIIIQGLYINQMTTLQNINVYIMYFFQGYFKLELFKKYI